MGLNKDVVALIIAAFAVGLGVLTHYQPQRNSAVENIAMGLLGMAGGVLGTDKVDRAVEARELKRKRHQLPVDASTIDSE